MLEDLVEEDVLGQAVEDLRAVGDRNPGLEAVYHIFFVDFRNLKHILSQIM